jgi:hypothetical protein
MLAHNRRIERPVTITRHINLDRTDISDHGLGPGPVPQVATVSALDSVLRVTEMAVHLTLQTGRQHEFGPTLREPALTLSALERPGEPVQRFGGGLLRLEVSIIAIALPGGILADLYLSLIVAPLWIGVEPPKGWPGLALIERLAELATGRPFGDLDRAVPDKITDVDDKWRTVEWDTEIAMIVNSIEYNT